MDEAPDMICPPTPGLEAAPITLDQYVYLTPEKLDLAEGYLVDGPNEHTWRQRLLVLLLTNEGLLRAVQLAPAAAWRAALEAVYGEEG